MVISKVASASFPDFHYLLSRQRPSWSFSALLAPELLTPQPDCRVYSYVPALGKEASMYISTQPAGLLVSPQLGSWGGHHQGGGMGLGNLSSAGFTPVAFRHYSRLLDGPPRQPA